MTDVARVDQLLKYALAAAGQEDWGNRELGAIHLVKHVYLADLAHAARHHGTTFTGARWWFHHFGPWCAEVHERIAGVVAAVGADERRIPVAEDALRWTLDDDRLLRQLEDQLPLAVCTAIKRAVHQYGADTAALLDEVYRTRPMLRAAPGEDLDFMAAVPEPAEPPPGVPAPAQPRSRRAERAEKEALRDLRERVRLRLREHAARHAVTPSPPPRYDDVFAEGQAWLDALAGEPITPTEGTLVVADEVWKSRARREPDIP